MRKTYRFFLLSNNTGESLELPEAPVGWQENKVNLVRDLTYFGIIKSVSIEFEFVGAGYKFLQKHRLRYGWDMNVLLRVYDGMKHLITTKINTETAQEKRKDKKWLCDLVESGFTQKWQNREDIEVNVLNTRSLDQQEIAAAPLVSARFKGKRIEYLSVFDLVDPEGEMYYADNHTIPFLVKQNGNPGVSTPLKSQIGNNQQNGGVDGPDIPPVELADLDSAFIRNTFNVSQSYKIKWSFTKRINTLNGALLDSAFKSNRNIIRIFKSDGTVRSVLYSDITPMPPHILDEKTFSLNGAHEFVLNIGEYAVFTSEIIWNPDTLPDFRFRLGPANEPANEFRYLSSTLEVYQNSVIEDVIRKVALPHEIFSNLISQVNGGSLYSKAFGRIDLGYPADGEYAYLGITTGALLRDVPIEEIQIPMSMRSAFKSYSSIICLGAVIKDKTVHIDPLDELFNNDIIANIKTVKDLKINPLKEFMFNSIKSGYPIAEYEEENGRDEPNTTYQYSNSVQSVKKELDMMSVFNGDGYGIAFAIRAGVINTGTADSRYDKNIYLIDMVKAPDGSLMNRTLEGILMVDGIFSPETSYNLRIAPGQNILRWRKYLNIPLRTKDHLYFYQTNDKNPKLRIATELGVSNSGEDIQTGNRAYFIDEDRTFDCPITIETLFALLKNPMGRVEYDYEDEKFYDRLMDVDSETYKHKTQWRMIGTKPTPRDVLTEDENGPWLKYGDGTTEFIKYDDEGKPYIDYSGQQSNGISGAGIPAPPPVENEGFDYNLDFDF